MNATIRSLLLVMLPAAVLGSGCLHHYAGATHRATGVRACEVAVGESSCVESGRVDERGLLRHHVAERTTPGGRCDLVVVEQRSFDSAGVLIEHIVENRRCRVVDERVSSRYDLAAGVVVRRVERDVDHDDQIDSDESREVPLTEPMRILALTAGPSRVAQLTGTPGPANAQPAEVFASVR